MDPNTMIVDELHDQIKAQADEVAKECGFEEQAPEMTAEDIERMQRMFAALRNRRRTTSKVPFTAAKNAAAKKASRRALAKAGRKAARK